MKKILILATAGAGGDLQPLLAAAFGLRARGHPVHLVGDASVAKAVQGLGIDTSVTASELDLGPRLSGTLRESLALEPALQGEFVRERIAAWSDRYAEAVRPIIQAQRPDILLTSLFGTGVAHAVARDTQIPWCVINTTFYVGSNPPRPLEEDFAARPIPLFRYFFIPSLVHASLVLHATDREFDFNHTDLPAHHHYVGPLLWEAPGPVPAYLDLPGDPWVLVTLSSQQQDDVPLARAALTTLAAQRVRVLLTLGEGHASADLGEIPANANVEAYVPHAAVLQRSRLLLSHAGHGSVMKALWHGVPMVLVPWGRDQPGVAARAANMGVARVVAREELSEQRVAVAVQAALEDSAMRERALAAARRLQMQDPVATTCEWLERL